MQLVCTPLHLLALNMYNTPQASWKQRASEVWATCPQSTVTRMFRFLCAYGFGGICNKELTARGRAYNEEKYVQSKLEQGQARKIKRKRSSAVLDHGFHEEEPG